MTMKMTAALAALSAALLAGCGGGGDAGSPSTPPTGNFNAFAAWKNLVDPAAQRSWSVEGTGSDRIDYELGLTVRSAADATFPLTGSTLYSVGVVASSIDGNRQRLGVGLIETFFDATTYQVRGVRNTSTVQTGTGPVTYLTCDEIVTTAVPPTATKVNTSGTLYTANIRGSCVPGSAIVGTTTTTWSVEWDGFSATSFFCLRSEERDTNGDITTEKDCVEIEADGDLATRGRARIELSGTNTASLSARNY